MIKINSSSFSFDHWQWIMSVPFETGGYNASAQEVANPCVICSNGASAEEDFAPHAETEYKHGANKIQ
jgi:hypothetical protein